MSESLKIPSIVFINTLHDNPSAQWPKFYREARQQAYHLMQEFLGYPGGLLFLVLPLAEYNLIPQVTVGGVLQPPQVPQFPANLAAGATASQISTYRQEADFCTHYFRVLEAFKKAVLLAMGSSLVQAIADPLAGDAVTMDVLHIFDHLRATYGVLTSADIRDLQNQLQTLISGGDMPTFVAFSSNFSEVVLRLETAGQGLRPFQQMEAFTLATSHEHNISRGIERYVDSNPVLAMRSLPLMIAAVRTHLSNVHPMTNPNSYSALAQQKDMEAKVAQLEARFAAEIDTRVAAAIQRTGAAVAPFSQATNLRPIFVKAYCYVHGTCNHSGKVCKVMLADRSKYSNAKLNAKTPTDVPGGSTKG